MAEPPAGFQPESGSHRHARWVRISHWVLTASLLTLVFTGVEILMVHPRLYWGEAGNDLTPALLELPISRNHRHGGWDKAMPFTPDPGGPISASRTYDIFNQNGWGRSDVLDHLRFRVPRPSGEGQYGLLQKCAYSMVLFVTAPLMAWYTGI